MGQPRGENE